jgi:methylamine dehydrogenase light chain
MKWMDRITEGLADVFARNLSSQGAFALVGSTVAGVRVITHLPVDRRSGENHLHLFAKNKDSSRSEARGTRTPEQAPNFPPLPRPHGVAEAAVSCTNTKYCWMHGFPCSCCGGSDTSCPAGTVRGAYWSYCCSHRLILYYDCCGGTVTCPSGCPFCNNSSQPNWCGSAGGGRYVCTQAADGGAC